MTDKLAEAIEKPHKIDLITGAITIREEILEAARKYHAIPVVDVETLRQCAVEYVRGRHGDNFLRVSQICLAVDHLRATYPNGLKWKV